MSYLEKTEELESIAYDQTKTLNARILAFTELYFLHQGNTYMQARYVRQIQYLVE